MSGRHEKEKKPSATILIVTWEGRKFLDQCLRSVASQTFFDFEVLLVDNGSTDESWQIAPILLKEIPHRIHRLDRNIGFAAANNAGARMARGRWLAFLNQDAYPQPDWLARLMGAAAQFPGFASYASCLLSAKNPDRIDGAGDAYYLSGLALRRLHGAPVALLPQRPCEVFSACAAAALMDRDIFLRLGGFEESYFAYHEDVDLGFRLRLAGGRCLFVPDAVVRHEGASPRPESEEQRIYLGHRNLELTYLTNMPLALLVFTFPLHFLFEAGALLFFAVRGGAGAFLRAKRDAWKMLSRTWDRRRRVQQTRKVDSWRILRRMSIGCPDFVRRLRLRSR